MKPWYQLEAEEVLSIMNSSKNGLSQIEAEKLLKEKGENIISESKKKTPLRIFAEQFLDLLVIILIAAAIISALSGNLESTCIIAFVIILNAILSTIQNIKAEKSLASLKSLSSPNAKVIRDNQTVRIPSKNIVPGDLLVLEAGDIAAADGRILSSFSMQANESSLTGESANVDKTNVKIEKEVPLADRVNMIFSGSLITYGRAIAVVTDTGMKTEIGKIASLMNETKSNKTPLQISLDKFSKALTVIILIISALVFGLTYIQSGSVIDSLLFSVALAVAAIPEALGSIITIVQAIGTQKMAKEQAIMKNLDAVESLGCVSVICSDKTGTLTQNKMTVQQVYIDGNVILPEELDLKRKSNSYLLYDAVLSNDSSISDGNGVGDPTEFCLLEMVNKIGLNYNSIRDGMNREEEIPFDSDRKLMSTKYKLNGISTVFTKGALDVLLERSTKVITDDSIREITEEDRKAIIKQNNTFSENGLRVLSFGYKEVSNDFRLTIDTENNYIFLGLISIIDPPRPESKQAVADARRAGIKPIMITGDHKVTATAIAKEIGIFNDGDIAITGIELDSMSDEELEKNIELISVYARVSPENKIRIVDFWQKKGNIVAMTGDGVNDAPALKKADIGVAMGITGTEVSKDAASMILADDNFATIIKAVANGRNIYQNIKNSILFLLSGNFAGIIAILYTSIFALPLPFAPEHLLFINLLTDSLPAIAIGMEPTEKGLLTQKPRNPKEGIITKRFSLRLLIYGILIAICSMISYHIGLANGGAAASTMAFATLTLSRLFHGVNCRSEKSVVKIGITSNIYSLVAFVVGSFLLSVVLFIPPIRIFFSVAPLTPIQLGYIVLFAFIPTFIIQSFKIAAEKLTKNIC